MEAVLQGDFMEDFESYSLDQFPLRDGFRTLKSLFHYYIWNQSDNNGIYLADGMAAQQEYPLHEESLDHAADRFQSLYDRYLQGSNIYFAIVPDKGQYLAEESGHLSLDLDVMSTAMQQRLPWAAHVDLSSCLRASDYYRDPTDFLNSLYATLKMTLAIKPGGGSAKADDLSERVIARAKELVAEWDAEASAVDALPEELPEEEIPEEQDPGSISTEMAEPTE